jgi:predicted dehydrogenase
VKDSIDIIVVGCAGGRGSWFTQQISKHPSYRISALVDSLTEGARVVAREFGLEGAGVYADIDSALSARTCDAVLVATPDAEHASVAMAALEAGAYVYVEKPLAITVDDCLRLVAADEAAGGRCAVGFNLRYAPMYRAVRDVVRQGRIGVPLTLQADEFYYGGRTYFRRWNRLKSVGGGLWITKACHDFDILYWMADRLPLSVKASAHLSHYVPRSGAGLRCSECSLEPECPDSNLRVLEAQPRYRREIHEARERAGWPPRDMCLYNSDKDTFDHGIALVDFEDDLLAVYTVNVVASHTDRRIRIAGTEGMVEGSLACSDIFLWPRHRDPAHRESVPLASSGEGAGGHGGGDAALLDEFAAFVTGESSARVAPAEASVAVAMGLAATESADTNRVLPLGALAGWPALEAQVNRPSSGARSR